MQTFSPLSLIARFTRVRRPFADVDAAGFFGFSLIVLYASSRELSAETVNVEGRETGPLVLAALAASPPFRVYW